MQIKLDTGKKQVIAKQEVNFRNPSADTIWTMPFHLYYNAFKNNKTTFASESSGFLISSPDAWAWSEVTQVVDSDGNNLTDSLHYITPDDHNIYDQTVLEIRLKKPILPFQNYTIQMDWQAHIPLKSIRTGYNKDYYFMAQWYPKLGVYEPTGMRFATEGQWNCHQYHANTEYYGEFGVYDITIDVPNNYIVGASGFLEEEKITGKRKTYRYIAEDVIDFAWSANPDFIIIKDQWKSVEIQLYVKPEHTCNANRFLDAAKYTLDFFEDYIEPYPYPNLTIVSPPCYGLFSGAMEYPTLFTAPTLCLLPPNIRTTETLTMHELTHQYFMQMLATNEQEEPWLDEGFTAFFEAKMMDKYYPKGVFYWDYMNINLGSEEYRRGRFFNSVNTKAGAMSDFGWHFKHGGQREIFYGKGALTLQTLEGLTGEACMQKIIQTYFQRWKFKHPCRNDFITIVQKVVPQFHTEAYTQKVLYFLDQAIHQTSACDYKVQSISNKTIQPLKGYVGQVDTLLTDNGAHQSQESYEAKVILYRSEAMIVPQDILITFDNGEKILEKWDGIARSKDFTYIGTRKIVCVELDPNFKITLDQNLLNNSYTLQPDHTGITRYFTSFLTWIQGAMVSTSTLL
jgi:hypothetical protein